MRMTSRTFRLLLGLFFGADGLLFLFKAIRQGGGFYAVIALVWLIAAGLILASRRKMA